MASENHSISFIESTRQYTWWISVIGQLAALFSVLAR
jgi:hypothetical protein